MLTIVTHAPPQCESASCGLNALISTVTIVLLAYIWRKSRKAAAESWEQIKELRDLNRELNASWMSAATENFELRLRLSKYESVDACWTQHILVTSDSEKH